ncbi:MAG TPA: magnesium transporter [Thermoanaerobaculia bacterium]|nr:magnesium transporter [Thermoanaerobaculia bacterium]
MGEENEKVPIVGDEAHAEALADQVSHRGAPEAADLLEAHDDRTIAEVLRRINPSSVHDILDEMDEDRQRAVMAAAPTDQSTRWSTNQTYPEDSVGRLMENPTAVYPPDMTVGETVEEIRDLVRTTFVTYAFVTDPSGKLLGIITMRDLLLSDDSSKLRDVMLADPFYLEPDMPLPDAMKLVLNRHFPVYPVCEEDGRLVGLVRGQAMFEEQAFEISAQPGRMVGVDKEERLSTPWPRSLKFRHPWLQLNLVTAFTAAAVVGLFQDTIDQIVVLAVFLPVLAGQSGNTGCQALAVALRGMTLGELAPGKEKALVMKEGLLGLLNGALVGVSAGIGMYIVARMQDNPAAIALGVIVFAAMIGSCVISGIAGALIPLILRKLGADPATASSIFLTTATDVVSMGLFLGLATLFIL